MGVCQSAKNKRGDWDYNTTIPKHEFSNMNKKDCDEFEGTPLTNELLIYGYCHELEAQEMFIPNELIDICITYYTHIGQFYFDPIGYNQQIFAHHMYKRSLSVIADGKLLNTKQRHCVYILYDNGPINMGSKQFWTQREDKKVYYCTLRYNGDDMNSTSDCFFGVVNERDLTKLNKKNERYQSNIDCGWKHNECITIELDLKRYKTYYYKSYGNSKYFQRYTTMTKSIKTRSNNYYFMLCGTMKKEDSYTLISIGSDINQFDIKPILFL